VINSEGNVCFVAEMASETALAKYSRREERRRSITEKRLRTINCAQGEKRGREKKPREKRGESRGEGTAHMLSHCF